MYCCSTRLASSYSLIISLLTELGLLAWKKNWAFSDIACSDSISEICLCLMISSHIYTLHSPLLSGLFILPQLNTIAVTCTCIIYFVSLAIEMVSEGKKTHTEFSHLLANRSRTTVISKPFGIPYYLEGSSSRWKRLAFVLCTQSLSPLVLEAPHGHWLVPRKWIVQKDP